MEYLVPGGGIYNDTAKGWEVMVAGLGIYNETAAAVASSAAPIPPQIITW